MTVGSRSMHALLFDGDLRLVSQYPVPQIPPGWALIRVKTAGICQTDMEIVKGYMGFLGVLGHEFVGTVEESDDARWAGKRVTGEINAACGQCHWCASDMGRHCPNRTVMGILNLDGCIAEYCTLPTANLLEIPLWLSDDRAVLIEPLSAACAILEQIRPIGTERIIVLGDGRLGILCAWVLSTAVSNVTLIGHYPEKIKLAEWNDINMMLSTDVIEPGADIVIEATGSGDGICEAMMLCRPRGTIVLKSTVASHEDLNLAPIVINEIAVVGSRCGRFRDGLRMMETYPDMPLERLITARYPISQAIEAFDRAGEPDTLKVLLDM